MSSHLDPDQPPFPRQPAGPPDPEPSPAAARVTRLLLIALIIGAALVGVWGAAVYGELDSALVYVGLPCLIALGVAFLPVRGFGSVFQAVTVVLLLASALLQEGAVCVLLVSPLVYGVAGLVYFLASSASRSRYYFAPVLLVVALEGALPGARVAAVQQAEATRVTAADCTAFEAALARGPAPQASDRGRLLSLSGYPTPLTSLGEGLDVGDRWRLEFVAGETVTEVVGSAPGRLEFEVVLDTSKTARSVDLRGGTVTWAPSTTDPGRCRTTLVLDYERKLDPGFWFGPITAAFMDQGAQTFLRGLD